MEKESNTKESRSTVMSKFNGKLLFCQKKLADHLNFRCRNISSKGLLVILIVFTSLVSAILLKLVISGVQ